MILTEEQEMSVCVHTEWGKLKEVVVGCVVETYEHNVDLSFKLFYHQNIKHSLLEKSLVLQKRLIEQRSEDLENLATFLTKQGIKVLRPEKLKEIKTIETPNFQAQLRPMDNPRDLLLIVGDLIIETPVLNRARFFETDLLKKSLFQYFKNGARWISAPRPTLTDESFDYSFVKNNPGVENWNGKSNSAENFEIMFDAAQCLKFGRHILMNISTENHVLGAQWLQSILGKGYKVLTTRLTDHHIDGMIMPLRPGKLLVAPAMKDKYHLLPPELQKWDKIEFNNPESSEYGNETVSLASSNISVNVLSLDEKNVLVFSPDGKPPTSLCLELEKHGFHPHTIQLRHSKVFDGGLHCATLDTVREEMLETYL